MADIKKLANPASFGPGAWLVIHTLAYNAQTNSEKKHFQASMKHICNGLKCGTCNMHCNEYLKAHPVKDYWHVKNKDGKDVGMFKWSWAFHNTVNARLGKPILDYDTAYHLYSNSEDTVCTKENCEGDDNDHNTSHTHTNHKDKHISHSRNKYTSQKNRFIRTSPTKTTIRSYRR